MEAMKLYTKRGDNGLTDLFGGKRVQKDDVRVEAYGSVDELNSAVGLALSGCGHEDLRGPLLAIQSRLFELGADLATPRTSDETDRSASVPRITAQRVTELEQWIDQICATLPPMRQFILPGGSELAARLHVARTICRRAERRCVSLAHHEPIGDFIIIFLNRLSDLLFAMARRANQLEGVSDVPWSA
jgi:cob(I)alamin adenosyltransferase